MSLEKQMETLNTNIEKLISIFEAYPNPVDEATKKEDSAISRVKAKKEEAKKETPAGSEEKPDASEPEHTLDELAALAKKVLQADKATNRPKIQEKLESLGIKKISAAPEEHIDELYSFLESLEE